MNIGVIFAGGVGTRMRNSDCPKQFLKIYDKPIIVHTIQYFQTCPEVDAVVVVCVEGWLDYCRELIYRYRLDKVRAVVPGGKNGQESIFNGLVAAEELAAGEKSIVLIHDGVRPLITEELLRRNIADVKRYGSSITSAGVKETIVEIDDGGGIKLVPDRAHSRVAKAPQCFWLCDILGAHRKARELGELNYIDSCSMMHAYGFPLHMTEGPYENIKITTPDDFYTLRALLQAREDQQLYPADNA